jgi:hypothetical protein
MEWASYGGEPESQYDPVDSTAPSETVMLLFTDIEGSTGSWVDPEAIRVARCPAEPSQYGTNRVAYPSNCL